MGNDNRNLQDKYFNWLAAQKSPAQLSELYILYADIEKFCLRRSVITKKLFELTSLSDIRKVKEVVDSNKVFRFTYKQQLSKMGAAMQIYYRFMKEHPELLRPESAPRKPAEAMPEAVSHTDKQAHTATTAEQKKVIRSAWINWMAAKNMKKDRALQMLVALKNCGDHAVKAGYLNKDIYTISSASELKALFHTMLLDAEFVKFNRNQNNVLCSALDIFLQFLTESSACNHTQNIGMHSKQESPRENKQIPVDNSENSDKPYSESVSKVSELLHDERFAPLRIALEAQHVDTIEKLRTVQLWSFMNQRGLYSIATRQSVQLEVQALLDGMEQRQKQQSVILHCGNHSYQGEDACHAYLCFCKDMARKYPLRFRSFLGKHPPASGSVAVDRYDHFENSLKMENPTASINPNLTDDEILEFVKWMCGMCGEACGTVSLENVCLTETIQSTVADTIEPAEPEPSATMSSESTDSETLRKFAYGLDMEVAKDKAPLQELSRPLTGTAAEPEELRSQKRQTPILDQYLLDKMESIVRRADLDGISYDALRHALNFTRTDTERYVGHSEKLVEIKGKVYHTDAFVDWDEGADQLYEITKKLMEKNNGYISSPQLYSYVRTEMNMFLNDNGMNDERDVFDITQHLFEKVGYRGTHYTFTGKAHISTAKEAIGSNFDLICKFAEDQGGVFEYDELVDYCEQMGLKTGNLRGIMKLSKTSDFFYYTENVLIAAKSMNINDAWLEQVRAALKRLFADVGDHMILREIQPFWYEQLPILPGRRPWTPLLLQYVLMFYGKELGARTILAMDSQANYKLHTMLVSADSPIQNFGDVVVAWLKDSEIEQRSFEAEELRQFLLDAQLIQGNELIGNMSKALAHDERFAWDAKGENVTIRV